MKKSLIVLTSVLFCCTWAKAQDAQRNIHYQFVNKDSVRLSLNEDFETIEDSCAQIYRYAYLDTTIGKFVGHIKDVSRVDPSLIITEGNYDREGNKEGLFVSHFLNGKLESKGSFVKDHFDGKWELYYDDGSPRLNFEVHGKDIQLTDYWDTGGNKLVDKGKGKYKFEIAQIYWEGHLIDGRPAGSWFAYNNNGKEDAPIMTEVYKLGVFQVGRSPSGKEYKDVARMDLVTTDLLPFVRAELLTPSNIPCGVKAGNVVHPQYKAGIETYNALLTDEIKQALRVTDLKRFGDKNFSVTGVVDNKGNLTDLQAVDSFDKELTTKLLIALKRLPPLQPVVINGRRIKVNFLISFVLKDGNCNFNYGFTEADH